MESMASLSNEAAILSRLIYRNNNQHGKTPLFSSNLKPLNKMLMQLTSSNLEEINKKSEDGLRFLGVPKLSSHLLTLAVSSCNELRKYIQLLNSIIFRLLLSCTELRIMLDRKVFMPLFTVLYSLLARVCRITANLLVSFHTRMMALLSQIQRAVVLNPKYEQLVSSSLIMEPVADDVLRIIEVSGNVYAKCGNNSTSGTKKTILHLGAQGVSKDGVNNSTSDNDTRPADTIEEDTGEMLVDSLLTELDDSNKVTQKAIKRSYNDSIDDNGDDVKTENSFNSAEDEHSFSRTDTPNEHQTESEKDEKDNGGSAIDTAEVCEVEVNTSPLAQVSKKVTQTTAEPRLLSSPKQSKVVHNAQLFNDSSLFYSSAPARKPEDGKSNSSNALKPKKKNNVLSSSSSSSGSSNMYQSASSADKVGSSKSLLLPKKNLHPTAILAPSGSDADGTQSKKKKKKRLLNDKEPHVTGGEDIDDIFAVLY